ncbi:MAG: xanthine dehydrogenase family protein subunit M [Thaumarchaeota archaeon]|nr:xanthine dehydrogenase family protein subunit M [Nitrososphaerota archaeon]
MIPRPFEMHSPSTISEATLLLKNTDDSKALAGGQSLVPLMKLRLVSPAHIVDLGKIPGLSYIREEKGHLLIGSMTTHNEVATSPLIGKRCVTLSEAASRIGDHQVRNRGTIGGTLCHADPAGDVPAAAVALDAELKVAGHRKGRVIKARDFFEDVLTTSLRRDEILTEVRVRVLPPKSGGAYLKLGRGASDLATVGVAAVITLDKAGACKDVRLGLAGVGSKPIRATRAEDALKGRAPTDDLVAEAGERASEMSNPSSDIRGSADYKREMVKVYVRRAIRQSLARV